MLSVRPKIGKHAIYWPAEKPVPRSLLKVLENIIYIEEVTVLDFVFGYEGNTSLIPTLKVNSKRPIAFAS